ncbi:MAG: hypothetical protein AAGE61_17260 [Pseudomonadota bacterium]
MSGMRIQRLDVGVESISRWKVRDEQHLPKEGKPAPSFLPRDRDLDDILRRPSLDERLPRLLQPENVDPELLEPSVLSDTRRSVEALFKEASEVVTGKSQAKLEAAANLLAEEIAFDDEIRTALAALLRG